MFNWFIFCRVLRDKKRGGGKEVREGSGKERGRRKGEGRERGREGGTEGRQTEGGTRVVDKERERKIGCMRFD